MSNYELIAFDMDGTLLNSRKEISSGSLHAISRAVQKGKTVCLCTGRCIPELEEYLPVLSDIRYIIGESGVFVLDTFENKYIYRDPMDIDTAVEIFTRMKQSGEDVMMHLHSDRSIVQADKIPLMHLYNMSVYRPLFERACLAVEDITAFFLSDPFPPNKINIYCRTTDQWDRIRAMLADLDIEFKHVEGQSLECVPKKQTKGTGLTKLCEHLALPVTKAIAVGDADNDLEMLEAAGLAIAMGNANEAVLKAADFVVADNDHEGCAEAIDHYLL